MRRSASFREIYIQHATKAANWNCREQMLLDEKEFKSGFENFIVWGNLL